MSTPLGSLGGHSGGSGGGSGERPEGVTPEEYQHLDLDVHNYTLQELLDLLKLPQGFSDADLRRAMRQVASLHPDRSGAPVAVYRLFYEAHVLCRQLLKARSAGDPSTLVREDYDTPEGHQIAEEMTAREDFQSWFNKSFEEYHKCLFEKSEGHGAWLKEGNDDEDWEEQLKTGERRVTTQQQMAAEMAKYRKQAAERALVLANGPMAATDGAVGCGTLLSASDAGVRPLLGGSVGDVSYGDVKRSYEESVVPIAALDGGESMYHRPKTMEELMREREQVESEAAAFLRDKSIHEEEMDRQRNQQRISADARMHALLQEEREVLDAHQRWLASSLRLTDGRTN